MDEIWSVPFGMQLHDTGHDSLVEGAKFSYCASSSLASPRREASLLEDGRG
jgi:hypothetical protein